MSRGQKAEGREEDKDYRVGVIGLIHDHVWGLLRSLSQCKDAALVAAADPHEPLLERVRAEGRVEATYRDYRELLDGAKVDAVLCCTENNRHAEVVEASAEVGVHVMVEKPMAATLAQADRMLAAAQKTGIRLMVNWPIAWNAAVQHAFRLAREGAIGRVYQLRFRAGHRGPKEIGCSEYFWRWLYDREKNGAGALMDFCCYGANLCAWFWGPPRRVMGIAGRWVKGYDVPDDNAILLLEYDRAMGLCEGSWAQVGGAPESGPILSGSDGTLAVTGEGVRLMTVDDPQGRLIESPPLPEGMRSGPEHFLSRLAQDRPIEGLVSPLCGRIGQEILEAGLRSAETGATVQIPL